MIQLFSYSMTFFRRWDAGFENIITFALSFSTGLEQKNQKYQICNC